MGGVVACDERFARALRQIRIVTGSVLHPFAGYLLLRGLATLPVRVRRASATAAELADRLAEHPAVSRVLYPGRPEGRRVSQMDGGGCLITFEASGNPHAVIASLRLITPAVSLGGVDTLIQHPASLTHRIVGTDDRLRGGITDGLLRLSIGLEDLNDLWHDLDRSLSESTQKAD
jgi:methionine-gamma-lyase